MTLLVILMGKDIDIEKEAGLWVVY